MTTIETVTASQIKALRDEPAQTGAEAWCLARVVELINDAEAMRDQG